MRVTHQFGGVSIKELERRGDNALQAACFVTAENALSDCKPNIPYLNGDLTGSGKTKPGQTDCEIMWGTDEDTAKYARYQYYTKGLNHPKQGSDHWFEKTRAERKDAWGKIFAQKAKEMMA